MTPCFTSSKWFPSRRLYNIWLGWMSITPLAWVLFISYYVNPLICIFVSLSVLAVQQTKSWSRQSWPILVASIPLVTIIRGNCSISETTSVNSGRSWKNNVQHSKPPWTRNKARFQCISNLLLYISKVSNVLVEGTSEYHNSYYDNLVPFSKNVGKK